MDSSTSWQSNWLVMEYIKSRDSDWSIVMICDKESNKILTLDLVIDICENTYTMHSSFIALIF